ncbi:hypothetical protein P775_10645 [Puniceibacterium antarcticum]|uniref:ATP synthase subunit b n=1 Tax=Puniceibacterium antarcticum TaxID=1206336 RepID=A0A2G8RGB4_9RHOB|nr:ATP synthase F0 subunit B [Puniceibacterium antarcticum]PIL20118.1 hypothetical protein P775_10645 [Puniceibacterium antarcticum]
MTIDFWGLGLQAVNVLILVWLLSRLFWRPVAAAIATRQDTALTLINTAKATQAKADAALAEVTQTRADISSERTAVLVAARKEAEAATSATLADAQAKADALLAAAKTEIATETETARKANAAQATDLSLDIATRLLGQLNSPTVQAAFLSQLLLSIAEMPAADRAALKTDPNGVRIATPTDPGAEKAVMEKTIRDSLGDVALHFVTDPDLIAGVELRSAHFVLHNSWQADLSQVRKAVKHAA